MKTSISLFIFALMSSITLSGAKASDPPHIVFVMADDQGWGQTSYNGHPQLKTPNLDAMAAAGLRFDRFYAGASNCSPSRATVLTGRSNDRTGVETHGFPLRLQEKTIAQALSDAGYATGHFGKWHLNGLRGPGVPVLGDDTHSPGAFGFQHWLTTTNFFDMDPILGRMGEFEEFKGDSSEVVVGEALKFIKKNAKKQPTFTVIWYGTPHDPMKASEEDRADFAGLPEEHQHQYGEIVAMDRSVGALREGLRELGIAENTLFWYTSDNGGLSKFGPETMGGLRGSKNTMYEGGLRVPGIIEWPARISERRITDFPAGTVDMFPTIAEIVGLPDDCRLQPQDGISLVPVIDGKQKKRGSYLPFRHDSRGVLTGDRYKIISQKGQYELYDLEEDQNETTNLIDSQPEVAKKLIAKYEALDASLDASVAGKDYPEGSVDPNQPERRFWVDDAAYLPYFSQFAGRWEYGRYAKELSGENSKKDKRDKKK